jgi:hypothetical protein
MFEATAENVSFLGEGYHINFARPGMIYIALPYRTKARPGQCDTQLILHARTHTHRARARNATLLDTLLSKRSDDDQEMKIWRPRSIFVATMLLHTSNHDHHYGNSEAQ